MSPDERRFYRYVAKSNRCWIWLGTLTRSGQGQFYVDGRPQYAHVWIWEQEHGPKPLGMQLSPTCRWSKCVNPDHRELRPRGSHIRKKAA